MYSSSEPAAYSAASSFICRTISSHVPTYVTPAESTLERLTCVSDFERLYGGSTDLVYADGT